MKFEQSKLQKGKAAVHLVQALFIFIAIIMTIAVFTKADTDGRSAFYLAMGFITAPALIYLTMTPMWPRAVRFANPYAFVAIDIFLTIMWFSASIAVGTWNAAGIKKGRGEKPEENKGNCSTFGFGTETSCNVSKATVGFGVLIFLMFILTSTVSVQTLVRYRQTGDLNAALGSYPAQPAPTSIEAQTTDAWSSDTHDIHGSGPPGYHRDGSISDDGHRTERGGDQEEDEHRLLHATESDDGPHPGRFRDWGSGRSRHDDASSPAPPYDNRRYSNPSAVGAGGYDDSHTGGSYDAYRAPSQNYNFSER